MNRPHPVSSLIRTWVLVIPATVAGFALVMIVTHRPSGNVATPATPAFTTTAAAGSTMQTRFALERFLNHHPLLEDALRAAAFEANPKNRPESSPEWKAFRAVHPDVTVFLARDPDFLVLRALRRETVPAMNENDETLFASFLNTHPDISRSFALRPEQARATAFVSTHPAYREFLDAHLTLSVRLGLTDDPDGSD